jgi:ferredoxin
VRGEDGEVSLAERSGVRFARHTRKAVRMVMRVWIDRELCTGDGLCEEICPDSFQLGDDNLAYVREDKKHFGETRVFGLGEDDPTGPGQARVPMGQEDDVIEAAEQCPAECILVEAD